MSTKDLFSTRIEVLNQSIGALTLAAQAIGDLLKSDQSATVREHARKSDIEFSDDIRTLGKIVIHLSLMIDTGEGA